MVAALEALLKHENYKAIIENIRTYVSGVWVLLYSLNGYLAFSEPYIAQC